MPEQLEEILSPRSRQNDLRPSEAFSWWTGCRACHRMRKTTKMGSVGGQLAWSRGMPDVEVGLERVEKIACCEVELVAVVKSLPRVFRH